MVGEFKHETIAKPIRAGCSIRLKRYQHYVHVYYLHELIIIWINSICTDARSYVFNFVQFHNFGGDTCQSFRKATAVVTNIA